MAQKRQRRAANARPSTSPPREAPLSSPPLHAHPPRPRRWLLATSIVLLGLWAAFLIALALWG